MSSICAETNKQYDNRIFVHENVTEQSKNFSIDHGLCHILFYMEVLRN